MVARGREEWSGVDRGWTTHFVFISVIYPASIKLNGITPTESVAEDAFSFVDQWLNFSVNEIGKGF